MSLQEDIIVRKEYRQKPFVIREGKFKFASLRDSFYHLDWAEESFLSGNNEREMLRRTFDLSKVKYIAIFIVVFLLILMSRVFWLQVVRGGYYYSMAEGNRIKTVNIEPKRGIIYDRLERPLVKNEANFVLYLIPNDLPEDNLSRDNVLRLIGFTLDNGEGYNKSEIGKLELISDSPSFYEIKDKLDKINLNSLDAYQPLFIKDNLDHQVALKLYLASQDIPGVFISNKIRRNYVSASTSTADRVPLGESSLSHILGYTGKINEKELENLDSDYSVIDYLGKTGIEYSFESELKGLKGQKDIEVDALGKEKKIVSQTLPEDGHNLILSIDYDLQKKVEEIIKDNLKKLRLNKASVIVMNPQNGEVLALVSWPAYNNNIFARGIKVEEYNNFLNNPYRPLFNRAVSGEFPAGSTFKPIMAAAALEEKIITANTTFLSSGGINVSQWSFPDWKAGGHGLTNVKKAISESVNTFFYIIGGGYDKFKGLGIDKIIDYSAYFGLGRPTGIDIPNEASGFLPTPKWKEDFKNEQWYIGDTYHVSIGQGDILTTPLQVANYTSFFANSGKLYKPHLVTKIMDNDNKLIREIEPEIIKEDFISPENINIVRQGMYQTINSNTGSARSLASLSVKVAGKTGTAQWSSIKAPQAWFTGFAPYENPEIVFTILIEEGGEGSSVAVPIAREILEYYFNKDKNNLDNYEIN